MLTLKQIRDDKEAAIRKLAKKGVDGVYDSAPKLNPEAKKFDELHFMDVLNKGLQVMDGTAATICMDNHIPLLVFSIDEPDNIVKVVQGEKIGTILSVEK